MANIDQASRWHLERTITLGDVLKIGGICFGLIAGAGGGWWHLHDQVGDMGSKVATNTAAIGEIQRARKEDMAELRTILAHEMGRIDGRLGRIEDHLINRRASR